MPEDFREIQDGLSKYVKIGTTIFLALASLFIFFISNSIQRRRRMTNKQKEMKSQFTQILLQTQLEIQEQTLKTISQEIHDNIGQVLSLAKLNLNTLEMGGGNKEQKIETSIQLVSKAIKDLRALSRSLNGDKISDLGLHQAVENELTIIQNTGLFETTFVTTGEPYPLLQQNEIVLFRIVQESLNNAVKHSKAKNIRIEMHYETNALNMLVNDDGAGFDTNYLEASQTGIGLSNMKSRALLVGAIFSIQSQPGCGTNVLIQLPQPTT